MRKAALHSTCIVYMRDYGRGVRAAPIAAVCSLLTLFYISWGKVLMKQLGGGGGGFLFLRQHIRLGKIRCQSSAFASNVYVNMPASILSHSSHKIKVNKGGVTVFLASPMTKITSASKLPAVSIKETLMYLDSNVKNQFDKDTTY